MIIILILITENYMKKIYLVSVLMIPFLSFSLPISAEDEVQEVVVISSKYPVPLEEVVGSVDAISVEDLELSLIHI